MAIIYLLYDGLNFTNAQSSGFSKTYFLDDRSTFFHAVRPLENDVIVLGQLGGDSLGLNGVFVAHIDTFGTIQKVTIVQDPLSLNNLNLSYYSCEAITSCPDGGFVFSGATRFSKNLFLVKVNRDLEVEYFREYECNFLFRYVNFMIYYSGAYYTFGIVQTLNKDFDTFIQKSDLSGNQIWEKSYGISNYMESWKSAIIEKNGLTILGAEGYDPDPFIYNDTYTWNKLIHIDTSGKIQWQWKSNLNEEGFTPEGLLKIGNYYYYTTHPGYQSSSQTIHQAPEIVCRDSSFNLKWRRTYGDTLYLNWFSTLTTGPDSFIYAAGYIPVGDSYWGRVCKIDPENGDLIWDSRDTAYYIPGYGSLNQMEGLTVLPSGSVIAVGYTMDYTFHENGLLYKVAADGCIDTLCTTVGIEEYIRNQDKKIKVFPNPAVDEIIFDLGDKQDGALDMFNLQGINVLHQKLHAGHNTIDIPNSWTSGVYVWRVTDDMGSSVETGKMIVNRQ